MWYRSEKLAPTRLGAEPSCTASQNHARNRDEPYRETILLIHTYTPLLQPRFSSLRFLSCQQPSSTFLFFFFRIRIRYFSLAGRRTGLLSSCWFLQACLLPRLRIFFCCCCCLPFLVLRVSQSYSDPDRTFFTHPLFFFSILLLLLVPSVRGLLTATATYSYLIAVKKSPGQNTLYTLSLSRIFPVSSALKRIVSYFPTSRLPKCGTISRPSAATLPSPPHTFPSGLLSSRASVTQSAVVFISLGER